MFNFNDLKEFFSRQKDSMITHRPDIEFGAGLVCSAAALIFAIGKSRKTTQIIDEYDEELAYTKQLMDDGDISEKDARKRNANSAAKVVGKLALTHAPDVMLEVAGIALLTDSHTTLNGIVSATSAALLAQVTKYNNYRKANKEINGAENEGKVLEKAKEISNKTDLEKPEQKECYYNRYEDSVWRYDRYPSKKARPGVLHFSKSTSRKFSNEQGANWAFLKSVEAYCIQLCISRHDSHHGRPGYLYAEEVYPAAGFMTESGSDHSTGPDHIMGWIYWPEKNIVQLPNFGLDDDTPEMRAFKTGWGDAIDIDLDPPVNLYEFFNS